MMWGFESWSRRQVVSVVVLSLLAAWIGLALSFEGFLTPRSSFGQFKRIAGDGWIQDGAEVRLSNLAPLGNFARLKLDPWRPPGRPPAEIAIKVCDNLVTSVRVTPESSVVDVPLKGSCSPRSIGFQVLNPFVPSDRDQRQLGAKLQSLEVRSRLVFPVLNPLMLLEVAAALVLLSLLMGEVFFRSPALKSLYRPVMWAVPVGAALMLSRAENLELVKLFGLWLLFTAVTVGALVVSRLKGRALGDIAGGIEPSGISSWWGAAFIVLLAAVLRLYGISFGLPANFHPDEVPKVNAIMRMVQNGNLDPQYFLHPSFLLYLTYLVNSVIHWLGIPVGEWLSIPGDFRNTAFLSGRLVSATAGTLSVWFVYCIGRRLFSQSTGLMGAALLAVLPLHVTCSRYMKEDALLTCMVLATVAVLLKAVQEDKKGWLLFAGFLAGMSASSKYSGLLAVGIVASAPWLRARSFIPDRSYFVPTLAAVACSPLGFLACTPYAVLNSATFLKDFGSESKHMLRGHTIPIDAWSQFWMYHFWRSVIPGMSMGATLIALAGVGMLLWRRRIEDLFIVGLVLLFYLPAEWVKAKPEPQPERYIYPCLPFLAIAAAECIRLLRNTPARLIAPALMLIMMIAPAQKTIALAREIPDDTRDQMARWMKENLPAGSKVYLDWKPYAPRFFAGEFQITHIPRAHILEQLGVDNLRKSGYDYLVLSSLFYDRYYTQPLAAPMYAEHLKQVFERVPIVKQITASRGTYGFHNPRLTLFSLKEQDFARLDEERALKQLGKLEQTSNEMRAQFGWESK